MNEKGVKRKKKSFFQQSMKYHKKGIHGKGARIDDESYEYFLNVLKIMGQDFESDDDKKVFVDNVFVQLDGNEVSYSHNQLVSRVIDNLLPLVTEEVLSKFMTIFLDQIRPVCMDQFASFVLQKLISIVAERYLKNAPAVDTDINLEDEKLVWLLKVSRFVLNNLEEFVFSNFPNRIMRTVICCLIGHTKPVNESDELTLAENTPKVFKNILKEFADQLLEWPRFNELPSHTISSSFLQVVLRCIATIYPKRVKKLGVKLLNECFVPEIINIGETTDTNEEQFTKMAAVFNDECSIRLLETVISVAPPKLFTQIYIHCFFKRLPALTCHPKANFSIQKLIRFCTEKNEFEAIFDELAPCFEDILEQGKSGVILELCVGCLKHKTKQSVFMLSWMKYLKCDNSKEAQSLLAPLTIYLKNNNQYDAEQAENVQLHGSLLLQNMLKFNKPIKIISSLLQMKSEELCSILCNPKGSHIANACFESEFVGEKSREKLFKVLQGHYSTLAVSKHGSRVFDLIWQWSHTKNKSLIAGELLENEAKLSNSPFGRPIIYNISLGTFRRDKNEWIKAQSNGDKVKKLFANIIQ